MSDHHCLWEEEVGIEMIEVVDQPCLTILLVDPSLQLLLDDMDPLDIFPLLPQHIPTTKDTQKEDLVSTVTIEEALTHHQDTITVDQC